MENTDFRISETGREFIMAIAVYNMTIPKGKWLSTLSFSLALNGIALFELENHGEDFTSALDARKEVRKFMTSLLDRSTFQEQLKQMQI